MEQILLNFMYDVSSLLNCLWVAQNRCSECKAINKNSFSQLNNKSALFVPKYFRLGPGQEPLCNLIMLVKSYVFLWLSWTPVLSWLQTVKKLTDVMYNVTRGQGASYDVSCDCNKIFKNFKNFASRFFFSKQSTCSIA